MVQQQLVDYIKSQLGLGTTKDAVRGALISAGWQAADVDDSFAEVEYSKPAADLASRAAPPMGGGPSVIKVNDLLAGVDSRVEMPAVSKDRTEPAEGITPDHPDHPAHHFHVGYMVLTVIATALVGVSALLYFKYTNLQAQVTVLNSQLSSSSAQVKSLTSQVNDLTLSRDGLQTQVGALTSSNSELTSELSFFITPAISTGTQGISVSLVGALSTTTGGRYVLTTADGLRVYMKNSESVSSTLSGLVGVSSTQIVGTHLPKSTEVTVTSINGSPISQ